MSVFFKVILPLSLIAVIGYFFFTDESLNDDVEKMSDITTAIEVEEKQKTVIKMPLPDYDTRRKESTSSPVNKLDLIKDYDADSELSQSAEALQSMITEYNDVLSDSEARKQIAIKAQEAGDKYKKAILAKIERGEL